MIKVYGYMKCDTCRKALKWLDTRGVEYQFIDITEQPPSQAQLKKILSDGNYELKHLFNTSGQLYRQMDIKTKLPTLSQAEAIKLLAANGMLVKRPIVVDGDGRATVGFKEDAFEATWA